MLTFEQIKELVELASARRLAELEIERSGFRLVIRGEAASAIQAASPPAVPPTVASTPVPAGLSHAESTSVAPAEAPAPDLHVVTSPIVGTFYAAPSPDAPPYVRVGDRVRKGQVLCIVEAMKLMNEIESDSDGVIAEIYPQNAQPVEYGEALFGLRAD